jgi:transcription-repair coupling factor (superfamily II helicase)
VYAPGQFAVRGGIVDIFSFSHFRPYRIEFFGDTIESIRDFEIEDQLSVAKFKHITVVPNVRAKFLSDEKISLLEYLGNDCAVWIKDAQMTLDVVKNGYKKSKELWEAIPMADKNQNPEWLNPNQQLLDEKMLASQLQDFTVVEFGKQFFYKADYSFSFDFSPQPSFNKDFSLLIHNLKKNEAEQIENYIFTDSAKQSERLYSIFEDLDKTVKFTPIHLSLREGFVDRDQKLACYTDHQIFDRYYKYQTKKAYVRSQALTLKELRDLKPGELLDGEGGYTVWGKLLPAATSKKMGGLPLGLAHGVKVVRPVAKGQSLSWDDVAMDTTTYAHKIRREMEAGYSF